MAPASLKLASDHTVADGTPLIDRPSETSDTARRIERLPTEVGVLLLSAGITMGLTPPPPGPFDLSIMLSGGLILWPRGFRAIDGWARQALPDGTPGRHAFSRSLPVANRQRIASFFPTAHRFVFVASDRQRIASIGGRGNCCSRHSGTRSLPFLRCLRPCR